MWTERSHSYWMPCTNGSQEGSFKLQEANFWGQGVGRRARSPKVPMIGSPNEITLSINNIRCTALIDTGATVSTISEAFYHEHLSEDVELHSIEETIRIECADGQQMPYIGYVSVNLTPFGIPGLNELHDCLFLVVPNSTYNSHVPVLIGTNILQSLIDVTREEHGSRFLQEVAIQTP